MSLDQISNELQATFQDRLQTDQRLQGMNEQRSQLPVFNAKQSILDAIYDNPVVIIRGNTGCGKTTQVITHCVFFYSTEFYIFFFFQLLSSKISGFCKDF